MTDISVDPNADIEALEQDALLAEKSRLISLSNGNAGNLPDPQLVRLCRIFTALRKRSSGPPKAAAAAKVSIANKSASELL